MKRHSLLGAPLDEGRMLGQRFLDLDWGMMGLILADSCEGVWGVVWYFYGLSLIQMHPILSVRDRRREGRGIAGGAYVTRYQKNQVTCK